MADLSPPARVVAAMPGTIHELAEATGYGIEATYKAILNARREGVRVNAVEDGISRSVSRTVDPEWRSTTVFSVLP